MISFDTLLPVYLSENKIEIGVTAANADFIAFEVVVDGNMVGSRLHVIPINDKAKIDVKSMVHAELILLESSIVSIEDSAKVRKPIDCKVRAAIVQNGTTGTFTDSSTFKVHIGYDEDKNQLWHNNYNSENGFLSVHPTIEKINIGQHQFLTYFNHFDTSSGQLFYKAIGTYKDGSNQTTTINIDDIDLYDCLVINTGTAALNLPTTDLVKYDVGVYFTPDGDITQALSEIRTYTIYIVQEHFKDILYFNNWYAPKVIRLTGAWSTTIQTDYLRFESENGINQITKSTKDILTAKSAFVEKAVSVAMKQLYRRSKAFLITANTAQLLLLDKKKFKIENTFQFLYVIFLQMTVGSESISFIGKSIFVNGIVETPAAVINVPAPEPVESID